MSAWRDGVRWANLKHLLVPDPRKIIGLLTATWLIVAAACGARSELRKTDPAGGQSPADAGTPDGSNDGNAPDAPPPPPPPPCILEPVGEPIELLSFVNHNANASDLAVLEPGSAATSEPAIVAVKARDADANMWHPEIHLARVQVAQPWPSGVVIDKPLTMFVFESHEWGTLSHAAGFSSNHRLAMLWHYAGALVDPPSLRFQTFDTQSWTAGTPVDITFSAGASLALVPGQGVDPSGVGYGGHGYGVAYRSE